MIKQIVAWFRKFSRTEEHVKLSNGVELIY